jgi:hypothetical protein
MTTTREQQRRYGRSEKGRIVNKRKTAKYRKTEGYRRWLVGYNKKRRLRQRDTQKTKARGQIAYKIKKGEIVRPNHCTECGTECKPYAHHDDYEKPLDIRWLCQSCDSAAHKKQKEATAIMQTQPVTTGNQEYVRYVTQAQRQGWLPGGCANITKRGRRGWMTR